MPYYTTYKLTIVEGDDNNTNYTKELAKIAGSEELGDFFLDEDCKWYDHDEHMSELSRKYSDTTFQLDGYGEDREDEWRKYYNNGNVYEAEREVIIQGWNEIKRQQIIDML